MQDGFQIGLFLRTDPVTADLAMVDRFQIHRFDQVVDRQLVREV